VSAAAEKGARTKHARKKRKRVKMNKRKTAPPPSAEMPAPEAVAAPIAPSPVESVAPREISHIAQRPPTSEAGPTRRRTVALGSAAALVVVAALAFPRLPSAPDAGDELTRSQSGSRAQFDGFVAPPPQPAVRPVTTIVHPVAPSAPVATRLENAPSTGARAPRPENTRVAKAALPSAPIAAVAPVAEIPFKESAPTRLTESAAVASPAPASVSTVGSEGTPVTITGCLEVSVDQDDFRLTDTEGANAPRSRSWRTGFLRKRSAPVALIEPPDRLALQTHVGRRVAATGLLTSHDLKVSTLRVVGPSCN
jgi:hypothetical protein